MLHYAYILDLETALEIWQFEVFDLRKKMCKKIFLAGIKSTL